MTDEQLKNIIDFIGSAAKALEDKIDELDAKVGRILSDINGRLPKYPVSASMPTESIVMEPVAKTVPFSFVPSGCILNSSAFEYRFPIRVDSGGEVSGIRLEDGQFMTVSSGGTCTNCEITGTARFSAQDGARISGLSIGSGAFVPVLHSGAYLEDTDIYESGTVAIAEGGSAWMIRVSSGGVMKLREGARVENVMVGNGGLLEVMDKNISVDNIEVLGGGHIQFCDSGCKEALVHSGVLLEEIGAEESFLDVPGIIESGSSVSGGSNADDVN